MDGMEWDIQRNRQKRLRWTTLTPLEQRSDAVTTKMAHSGDRRS